MNARSTTRLYKNCIYDRIATVVLHKLPKPTYRIIYFEKSRLTPKINIRTSFASVVVTTLDRRMRIKSSTIPPSLANGV